MFSCISFYTKEKIKNMLHGYGDQKILKKSYLSDRQKALEDRDKYDDETLEDLDISFPDGGGRTNPDTFTISQFPFPVDQSIRQKKSVDLRKVIKKIGGD